MRPLRRNDRGLSEIVGTLMLVLIVVTAATLFAAFVASYQKQVQAEESFSHDQSLESVHILSLETTLTSSGAAFASFAFTIASEYVNPSGILAIFVNNDPLTQFAWENLTTGTSGTYNLGQNFILSPYDVVQITLGLSGSTDSFSGSVPLPNSYIKFDVDTALQNVFERIFLPPTALAIASETNPSGSSPILLFDGSTSFQSGANSSIVEWAWTIEDTTTTASPNTLYENGEEIELSPGSTGEVLAPGDNLLVTLVVTNNEGLDGSTTISYTVPSS